MVEKQKKDGIDIIGNYIFGLSEDNLEGMQQTLELARDLNCEFANFYCTMTYSGSQLYRECVEKGIQLPDSWTGYSYECLPLPRNTLSSAEVLEFRDKAFDIYFTSLKYLHMIEKKFGLEAKEHIQEMTQIKKKVINCSK